MILVVKKMISRNRATNHNLYNGVNKLSDESLINDDISYYVFVKKGCRHYAPQYLSAGMTTVEWIFSVPKPNTVGTLDEYSNGLVFIKFGDYGKAPENQIVAQNFSSIVYGPFIYRFCPNIADDMIIYSQTRDAVVANVKTGEAFYADGGLSVGDFILDVQILDSQEKLFVIAKSIKNDKQCLDFFLHVAKLEGQNLINTEWSMYLGETDHVSPNFPLYHAWYVRDGKLFVYDQNGHKIICTDGKALIVHPFSEVFNTNRSLFGTIKDIAIHPKLPFVVIIDENASGIHDLAVLRWDITNPKKKDEQVVSFVQDLEELTPVFGLDRLTLAYPSFSPDGNWYVVGLVGHEDSGVELRNTHFIAVPVVPVDKRHPYFFDIDNLVVLGKVAGLTSIAWTHDPVSYVVSNGELLHKWDLDELPNARVFELPEDGAKKRDASIFRRIARRFGAPKSPKDREDRA